MHCHRNLRSSSSNRRLPSFKSIKVRHRYERRHSLTTFPSVALFLDEDYQPIYFLAETFEDAKEKLQSYARSLHRPYELVYDACTQSLRILDNVKVVHDLSSQLKVEMDVLEQALDRLHTNGINFRVI